MQTYKKIQTYTNFQVKKCKKVLKMYKKEGVRPFLGANSYIIPKKYDNGLSTLQITILFEAMFKHRKNKIGSLKKKYIPVPTTNNIVAMEKIVTCLFILYYQYHYNCNRCLY